MEFTSNLLPLIYGGEVPTFEQVFGEFEVVANTLLETHADAEVVMTW